MEQIVNATPERAGARWRHPLRGWAAVRAAAVRPTARFTDATLRSSTISDEPPPLDGDDLLRRLREAGL